MPTYLQKRGWIPEDFKQEVLVKKERFDGMDGKLVQFKLDS
jgi:hypothetical protein